MLSAENKRTSLQFKAPLSGPTVPMQDVPDPVFSQGMVGLCGLAIDPTDQVLRSPCDGKIVQLHPSHHALTIETAEGVKILLHIGIDTVTLRGQGFRPKVKEGDLVKTNQMLIEFDADKISEKAKSLMSLMIIAEAPEGRHTVILPPTVVAGRDDVLKYVLNKPTKQAASAAGVTAESKTLQMALASGLHARPAARLVSAAKKYSAQVYLIKGQKKANAKSVVDIMGLEVEKGDYVRFYAIGEDAPVAVKSLFDFLSKLEEAHDEAPSKATPVKVAAIDTRPKNDNLIYGVGCSPGLAIGKVFYVQQEKFDIPEAGREVHLEVAALEKAISAANDDLMQMQMRMRKGFDDGKSAIFSAHQELLADPSLMDKCMELIEAGRSAAFAWNESFTSQALRLSQLNNELMAQRANDLRDVGRRVLRHLLRVETAMREVPQGSILIAEDLTPSDTAQMDRARILGFCTTTGGKTSHVAILARSLGIPAIAGIDPRALELKEGVEVILDGTDGVLRLSPTEDEKATVRFKQTENAKSRDTALLHAHEAAMTADGVMIEVAANIGGVKDAEEAVAVGCDGVGLLRSEFLFLDRETAPTEDEQHAVYQKIADILGPKRPLTIRTLDVGGDKPLKYLPIPHEENPFLGERGIRIGLLRPQLLREQLRAILRVKTSGELRVMFPMVGTYEEIMQAKAILEEERLKLGVKPISVGIMVEVPSAALIADVLAPEVDFFSIGTNDLTQYTLAIDRGHSVLAKYVDALHPSVLKLIEITASAAKKHGKWVGVCGGIASDAEAVPLLLGLGVTELSLTVPTIPLIKSQVRQLKIQDCKAQAQTALAQKTGKKN